MTTTPEKATDAAVETVSLTIDGVQVSVPKDTLVIRAAEQIGVDPNLTVAANSSGGVCGKMVSPQSISVATAATGLVGEEGTIFRFTLGHSIAMILFMSVLTYLQAYALRFMLP